MKISPEMIDRMQALADDGYSAEHIAEHFSVGLSTVHKYVTLHGNDGRRKKEKFKKGTTKRKIDLMKLLGLDYVERRIK